MNKEANAIFKMISEIYNTTDILLMEKYTIDIEPSLNSILAIIKETLLNDDSMFKHVFVMNYNEKIKVDIISNYMNLNKIGINASKDREEIIRYCANIMTYETLAKIFPSVRLLCNITLKNFVIAWVILSQRGALFKILLSKNLSIEDLSPAAAKLFKDKNKDNRFDIETILNGLEDDDLEEEEYEVE